MPGVMYGREGRERECGGEVLDSVPSEGLHSLYVLPTIFFVFVLLFQNISTMYLLDFLKQLAH